MVDKGWSQFQCLLQAWNWEITKKAEIYKKEKEGKKAEKQCEIGQNNLILGRK